MATYHCRLAATVSAAAILRYLDASGIAAADHAIVVDGEYRLILGDDDLAALKAHDLAVGRGGATLAS